jgi:hypothetical protein
VPISFLVDPHFQLVRTTYLGLITLVDVVTYARSLVDRGLLKSAHLIDARHATLGFSPEDTKILAELMKTLRAKHGSGPVAFVIGDAPSYYTAGAYQDLGAGGNPRFAVFEDVAAAEMWLELSGR